MNKFKVGDKVKRVSHPFCDMKVGDTGLIVGFRSGGNLEIEGKLYIYDPANFELVEDEKESTAKFLQENSWYITVNGKKEFLAAVKWLEEHGEVSEVCNTWLEGAEALRSSDNTGNTYIRTDMGCVTRHHKEVVLNFQTIVKSFTLPSVETEQEKKIRELQETIDKASAQIKAIKEGV